MQESDLEAILDIEKQAYQYPWGEGVFRDCLRMQYECLIAENTESRLSGYTLMSKGAGEGHILNLCTAPACRGMGLGRYLLDRLLESAGRLRLNALYLEVRPSNEVAIALYRSADFEEIGRRTGYYPAEEGREDAIVLARIFD